MKTHELANTLTKFAKFLYSMPNMELEEFKPYGAKQKNASDDTSIESSLKVFFELTKIDKKQWINLINNYGFNINIRYKDGRGNIILKLLTYLNKNDQAKNSLLNDIDNKNDNVSTELVKALRILLREK